MRETRLGNIGNQIPAVMIPTGTTQTVNWNNGNRQVIDLATATGPVTLTFDNPLPGAVYILKGIQGPIARDFLYPAAVRWAGGVPPVVSVANDAVDLFAWLFDGTLFLELSRSQAIA